jgi:hypothetical protein
MGNAAGRGCLGRKAESPSGEVAEVAKLGARAERDAAAYTSLCAEEASVGLWADREMWCSESKGVLVTVPAKETSHILAEHNGERILADEQDGRADVR